MYMCSVCRVGLSDHLAAPEVNQFILELKQISESVGYPFEIYYPDSDPEPFRIVANYFKQF